MELHILKNGDVNKEKWDGCIAKSQRSDIYALSWYLDVTNPNWKAIVFGDYEAVFPLPAKKKFGFINTLVVSYLVKDFCLYHGDALALDAIRECQEKVLDIVSDYFLVRIPLYGFNLDNSNLKFEVKKRHLVDFTQVHKYPRRLKDALNVAKRNGLVFRDRIEPDEALSFLQKYLEKKDDLNLKLFYYDILKGLTNQIEDRGLGGMAGIYLEDSLIACTLYGVFNETLYVIQNAGMPQYRKMAGMHLLFYELIERNRGKVTSVNFFGSNLEKVAMFLRNFSNMEVQYQFVVKR